MFMPLATLLLSASAAASPFGHLVHFHPNLSDQRVTVSIVNRSPIFQDLSIDGKVCTLQARGVLLVKAKPGTVVYAASTFGNHRSGDAVVRMEPAMNEKLVDMR